MSVKLTGRRRYRLHQVLFAAPLLVLQVEYEGYVMEALGGSIDSHDVRGWRDAMINDLVETTSEGEKWTVSLDVK